MPYSGRHQHPIGASNKAQGGAALNLGVEALAGESDMVTVFDDFNDVIAPATTFTAAASADGTTNVWEDNGWVLTPDNTPAADTISMNDPTDVSQPFESAIRIFTGTDDDAGGNMQLDAVNSHAYTETYLGSGTEDFTFIRRPFPHIWIPETASGAATLDNTVWTFACRVGMEGGAADGLWAGKYFIGWAEAGDTSILTNTDGVITQAETGPLLGFHCGEDGSIDGIAQRTPNTAYASGTNFVELFAAGETDGTTANGAVTAGDVMWFDLALRATITDASDDDNNGGVEFFYRRVMPNTGAPLGSRTHAQQGDHHPWVRHTTALANQTPSENDVALVPTIEVLNSPDAGEDVTFLLDWWTFGCSRQSRLSHA